MNRAIARATMTASMVRRGIGAGRHFGRRDNQASIAAATQRTLASALVVALALLVGGTFTTAGAQSLDSRSRREPIINASLSTGILLLQMVEDGRSEASWEFDVLQQYRGSLDRSVGNNTVLGISLGYAALPMRYARLRPGPTASPTCMSQCRANADLWSLGATLRVLSDGGFHQFVEINATVNQFSNFREEATGTRLAPLKADRDFSFTGGYGLGWAPGRRFQISAVMDVGFSLHSRSGRDADRNQLSYMMMGRIMVRSGI
jgi:hypothetical protein